MKKKVQKNAFTYKNDLWAVSELQTSYKNKIFISIQNSSTCWTVLYVTLWIYVDIYMYVDEYILILNIFTEKESFARNLLELSMANSSYIQLVTIGRSSSCQWNCHRPGTYTLDYVSLTWVCDIIRCLNIVRASTMRLLLWTYWEKPLVLFYSFEYYITVFIFSSFY